MAGAATNALSQRINFINFAHLAPLVENSKSAARLVSSIKSRQDLEQTNEQRLLAKCVQLGIAMTQVDGMMVPQDDQFIDFLRVLDRRIYDYDLILDLPEQYIAARRSKKT